MSQLRQLVVALGTGAAFLLTSAPATAQEQQLVVTGKKIPEGFEPVTKVVKIGDLNLATSTGVKEMNKRVAYAVNWLCPAPPANAADYEERDMKVCRDFAWSSVRPQMERAVQRADQGTSGRR